MLEHQIFDDDFPEDGQGVDPNAETQIIPALHDEPVSADPEQTNRKRTHRTVLPGFLGEKRLERLRLTPYTDDHHDRVSPLQGVGYLGLDD